jgi:alanyl-tRNA synthetase
MDVNKDELRAQFAKDWQKHYKLKSLVERGFERRKCKSCDRAFWSIEEREQCGDSSCIGYQFIGSTPVKKKLGYIDTWKAIEKYFTKNDHGYVKPYPTVARWRDDLYFTIASINDFQPYVVNGELDAPHNPLIVPQACIRFPDIANVGVSGRHYTNFVMIGQHAFNTKKTGLFYWKDEAIQHDLNYLKALGIPEKEIIFQEDVWAGGGNYGPSIEYFVRGLELGNCVFMQYEVTPSGHRELNTKVIDMGAGLNRLAWITSGDLTSYESVFGPVITRMKKDAGINVPRDLFTKYAKLAGSLNEDEVADLEKEKERIATLLGISKKELFDTILPLQALYASADHIKTLLFASTDGMLPSNSGGGYNIRMILRRVFGFAEQFGYTLDYPKIIEGHAKHVEYMFPNLMQGVETTKDVLEEELKRYNATKEKARVVAINLVKKAKASDQSKVPNKDRVATGSISVNDLITLYKSNGIAPEFIADIAAENGVDVTIPGNFYRLVREGEGEEAGPSKAPSTKILAAEVVDLPKTKELYYSKQATFGAKVLDVIMDKYVVLDSSGFYPEGGGQVADTGYLTVSSPIEAGASMDHRTSRRSIGSRSRVQDTRHRTQDTLASSQFPVLNTVKAAGVVLHEVKGAKKIAKGAKVSAVVDLLRRKTIARHHTSAHLVNAACREILGEHIWQGGSFKDETKGHLDVTHFKRISPDELRAIERKVNEYIRENMPISTTVLPRNEAEREFGFRLYQGGAVPGKELRVVSVGDIDHEACGGTHQMMDHTGEIGAFKIIKRESVQDGIERIVYKAGGVAIHHMQEKEEVLSQASRVLSVSESELIKSVERFFAEWKEQRKELEKLREEVVRSQAREIIEQGAARPVMHILDLDPASLRKLGTQVAESESASACLMNKAGNVVCAAGAKSKYKAKEMLDQLFKQLGGSGGGSDRIAQGKVKKVGMIKF